MIQTVSGQGRKIVQIAAAVASPTEYGCGYIGLFALADDGSLWAKTRSYGDKQGPWVRVEPLPPDSEDFSRE